MAPLLPYPSTICGLMVLLLLVCVSVCGRRRRHGLRFLELEERHHEWIALLWQTSVSHALNRCNCWAKVKSSLLSLSSPRVKTMNR
uniref:Putative secreted protein n=1 Tax=Anopheles darlingi TaxID=43151 RepID=A0A2M4DRB0_ANODA